MNRILILLQMYDLKASFILSISHSVYFFYRLRGDNINFSACNIENNEEVNTRIVSRNKRKILRQKYTQRKLVGILISYIIFSFKLIENCLIVFFSS
jgi:hypothetical protein